MDFCILIFVWSFFLHMMKLLGDINYNSDAAV
jgi:hypothetical protein